MESSELGRDRTWTRHAYIVFFSTMWVYIVEYSARAFGNSANKIIYSNQLDLALDKLSGPHGASMMLLQLRAYFPVRQCSGVLPSGQERRVEESFVFRTRVAHG